MRTHPHLKKICFLGLRLCIPRPKGVRGVRNHVLFPDSFATSVSVKALLVWNPEDAGRVSPGQAAGLPVFASPLLLPTGQQV